MANLPPEETYTLPDDPQAAALFVNSFTKKGYVIRHLTTLHVTVQPPAPEPAKAENAAPKKQLLQD